jgi:hypothetical protein
LNRWTSGDAPAFVARRLQTVAIFGVLPALADAASREPRDIGRRIDGPTPSTDVTPLTSVGELSAIFACSAVILSKDASDEASKTHKQHAGCGRFE